MKKLLIMVLAALSMLLATTPAFAQGNPAEDEGMMEGVFRVTIEGDVPENYSVYVETDAMVGGQGPICTTDYAMVSEGYTECAGGGATNELIFYAPKGETVTYRILGSQGTGLSQEVIAEGSAVAETDGLTVDANLAFSGEEETPEDPEETTDDSGTASNSGVAEDQYADETSENNSSGDTSAEANGEMSQVAKANGGILPDTGGAPLSLLAGAALLLASGGYLAYRRTF